MEGYFAHPKQWGWAALGPASNDVRYFTEEWLGLGEEKVRLVGGLEGDGAEIDEQNKIVLKIKKQWNM